MIELHVRYMGINECTYATAIMSVDFAYAHSELNVSSGRGKTTFRVAALLHQKD